MEIENIAIIPTECHLCKKISPRFEMINCGKIKIKWQCKPCRSKKSKLYKTGAMKDKRKFLFAFRIKRLSN